jgi:hypothetical protein
MREENFAELVEELSNYYNTSMYDDYLRRALGVIMESNLCSEIELPKEKKSEKPKFNQTKK